MRRRKKNPILVSPNHPLSNHQLSESSKSIKGVMDQLNGTVDAKRSTQMKLLVDIAEDPDPKEQVAYPITETVNVPDEFAMIFQGTLEILYNPKNNLKPIDSFVFLYLCSRYAKEESFQVGSIFWDKILHSVTHCQLSYTRKKLHESISKLARASIILRTGHAAYSLNKLLIYAGQLSDRPGEIKTQLINTIYNNHKAIH